MLFRSHRELWLFGEKTIEIWWNTGSADFPFQRTSSGFIEKGCRSEYSVAKVDNTIYWLGDDLAVYRAQGYQPQKISTPAIDEMMADSTTTSTAIGRTFSKHGNNYYSLTLDEFTVVYNTGTGLWSEVRSPGRTRWQVSDISEINNKVICGSCEDGALYELDIDTYTENYSNNDKIITSGVVSTGGRRRVSHSELVLDMNTGVASSGDSPVVLLRWSDDGGRTWSNAQSASAGEIGEYDKEVRFNRLGSFYNRIYRFSIQADLDVSIHGAWVREEPWL